MDRIKLKLVRRRRQINQPVVEAKHGCCSKAKSDHWLNIYNGETHPERVDETMALFMPE